MQEIVNGGKLAKSFKNESSNESFLRIVEGKRRDMIFCTAR
jgi:hypothetical protein